jgi:hypothetical protein
MDSIHPEPDPVGSTTVRVPIPEVVESVATGFSARPEFERALTEMSEVFDANPKAHSLLWNTSELAGYEPGNTALALKWLARQVQVRRVAILTRSQAIASLVHIGRVMVPGLDVRAFRIRVEALEWLATPLTGRPRTRSGRFKAA